MATRNSDDSAAQKAALTRKASAATGRYTVVSAREARAAARAKVTIDRRRARPTSKWIEELADIKKGA